MSVMLTNGPSAVAIGSSAGSLGIVLLTLGVTLANSRDSRSAVANSQSEPWRLEEFLVLTFGLVVPRLCASEEPPRAHSTPACGPRGLTLPTAAVPTTLPRLNH